MILSSYVLFLVRCKNITSDLKTHDVQRISQIIALCSTKEKCASQFEENETNTQKFNQLTKTVAGKRQKSHSEYTCKWVSEKLPRQNCCRYFIGVGVSEL